MAKLIYFEQIFNKFQSSLLKTTANSEDVWHSLRNIKASFAISLVYVYLCIQKKSYGVTFVI